MTSSAKQTSSSSSSSRTLKYSDGAAQFRLRLVSSLLSSRPLLLRNIRSDDLDAPGLREHEASFLRLLDRMTNGTKIEINATGTQLRFKPGVLLGGGIEHDCPTGRSVGWYLEGILPLAAFGKEPLQLTLRGTTDGTSELDPSPDYLSASSVPLMIKLGIGSDDDHPPPSLRVTKRGAAPMGGGAVELYCPIVKELRPLELVDFGKVKRVRGTAVSCRVPPSSAARVAHSAKGVLHRLLPDVWIHTDVHTGSGRKRKGGEGDPPSGCGPSPGLGVLLTATTTEGVCLSAECSMNHNVRDSNGGESFDGGVAQQALERRKMELPEDLGRRSATMLLHEIHAGGCVDAGCQSFALLMMCLAPEDVSRIRLGPLSQYAVVSLRLYKETFGVEFKLRVMEEEGAEEDEDGFDDDRRRNRSQKTVLCSCLGIGYRNMARAST
eukprot:CAMPEP_0172530234 /NCGR_PEP_ID=MMETSP1067-20121228/4026_1 /TAXON_ID=265564 ORGANISM="Thalassiosira punctigera, Strain Tpunct2005C2" /NCGR_SAMPLE_ID=MMETSP1067 /ASSEMBLY_ACC=CAM_ASM_000444 /LENGTH=436 /DNA_ID=CAMNT_0013314395 /DNA_START=120 /DNA_END=1430 /DNA_ORIENTATION=+